MAGSSTSVANGPPLQLLCFLHFLQQYGHFAVLAPTKSLVTLQCRANMLPHEVKCNFKPARCTHFLEKYRTIGYISIHPLIPLHPFIQVSIHPGLAPDCAVNEANKNTIHESWRAGGAPAAPTLPGHARARGELRLAHAAPRGPRRQHKGKNDHLA